MSKIIKSSSWVENITFSSLRMYGEGWILAVLDGGIWGWGKKIM